MQSRIDEIAKRNATVVTISADTVEKNRRLADSYGFEFPMLADPQLVAIDAYDLRHVDGGPFGDIARPAVYIIDERGTIVWRELTDNWRVRVRPETILERLDRIGSR